MNRLIAEWIGTVFNIGKLPLAPGTWSSLIASLTWFFLFDSVSPIILPIITLLLFTIGIISCEKIINDTKEKDPSRIVIDEWVGQWIAFTFMPVNISILVIGLILFRIFDIFKPFPVRSMEKLSGGWGIMMDDVIAGIMAYILLYAINVTIL
tara:strand:+ start:3985 stop:4440 length:456 start_codon:yes stop_codon:yes gene_type:complete